MSILKTESKLDETSGKMLVTTTYDNTAVLELNKAERNERIDGPQYQAGNSKLIHAARIDMGDVQRLINLGYNLLSPDPEETRRALLYIQSNEPDLLTVNSKPFAKVRPRWV
jgi:hypothetical protein